MCPETWVGPTKLLFFQEVGPGGRGRRMVPWRDLRIPWSYGAPFNLGLDSIQFWRICLFKWVETIKTIGILLTKQQAKWDKVPVTSWWKKNIWKTGKCTTWRCFLACCTGVLESMLVHQRVSCWTTFQLLKDFTNRHDFVKLTGDYHIAWPDSWTATASSSHNLKFQRFVFQPWIMD